MGGGGGGGGVVMEMLEIHMLMQFYIYACYSFHVLRSGVVVVRSARGHFCLWLSWKH